MERKTIKRYGIINKVSLVLAFLFGGIHMKLTEVKDMVRNINDCKGDFEMAHEMEDDLYKDVLKEVVAGNPEAQVMAREALKTKQIDFARYCA